MFSFASEVYLGVGCVPFTNRMDSALSKAQQKEAKDNLESTKLAYYILHNIPHQYNNARHRYNEIIVAGRNQIQKKRVLR